MVQVDLSPLIWIGIAIWCVIAFIGWCCISIASSFDKRFPIVERKNRKPRKPRLVETGGRDDEAA